MGFIGQKMSVRPVQPLYDPPVPGGPFLLGGRDPNAI